MPAYCHQILIHFKSDIIIENVKLLNLHILHLRKKKKKRPITYYVSNYANPIKKDQTAKRLCLTNRNHCLL